MASTDVTSVAGAVSGLRIQGPSQNGDGVAPARIELNDEPINLIHEGELDSAVGAQVTGNITGNRPVQFAQHEEPVNVTNQLFSVDEYTEVPLVDNLAVDELVIAFSGSVKYPASDPDGQALFNDLRLGKNVELRVAGFVSAKQGVYKMAGVGTDNEREVVGAKASIKIDSLWIVAPEQL